jgi:hypothetical protein
MMDKSLMKKKNNRSKAKNSNNRNSITTLATARNNFKYFYSDPLNSVASDGNAVHIIKIPGVATSGTTLTGALAYNLAISSGSITNFSTRFGAVFREYLIMKVVVKITATSPADSTNYAITHWYFDEVNSSAPTKNSTMNNVHIRVQNMNNDKNAAILTWSPRDYSDALWNVTSVSYIPLYLKGYTDTTLSSTGSNAFTVECLFTIAFRGFTS